MNALSIRKLRKTYNNGFEALKGIDLDVAEGDFFALLGPNGAGKSTAIGIISSLVNSSSGQVSIFGHDLNTDRANAKCCLGVVPQEVNFNQFDTVRSIVFNQAGYYGIPRQRAIERTEICLKQMDLWDKRDTVSRRLSGGMKRRVMIAKALSHEPDILFLDEPSSGVDVELRKSMWQQVRELQETGVSIILTTHYIAEAEEMANRIGIINKGKLILVEEKESLMKKLGSKKLLISLYRSLAEIPKPLLKFNLQLANKGNILVFSYDPSKEDNAISDLLDHLKKIL